MTPTVDTRLLLMEGPRRSLVAPALAYARSQRRRHLAELLELVRIPSISADAAHARDVRTAAAWLAAHLRGIGLPWVRVRRTGRHPVVLGRSAPVAGRPTVLVYGHYDVQPVEPVAAWTRPPFAARVEGGFLHGRGASDDKAQLFAHLKAVEALLRVGPAKALPVNVVVLLDGEEEIGSPHLPAVLAADVAPLRPDVAVASDTRMLGPDRPALVVGLRGSVNLEVEVAGGRRELHSGAFGGAFHNPVHALAAMVAGLVDEAGMIAVPHLYDRVRLPTGAERARLARHGPSDDQMRRDASGAAPVADAGWSLYERTTLLPALTVSGISGGYEGTGTRAAIPARALAKMNVRIVPSQRPREVAALIAVHLGRLSPPGLRTSVRLLSLANAGEIDRRHPALVVAGDAYGRAFGRRPALVRSGGTLPAVAMLHDILAVETVLMGFALPDDNMHAPDERFRLANLWRGIEASVRFLDGLGRARTR